VSFFTNTTYPGERQGVEVWVRNTSNLSQPVIGITGKISVYTSDGLPITSAEIGPTDLDGHAVSGFDIPIGTMNVTDRYLRASVAFSSVDYTQMYGWVGMTAATFYNSRYLEFNNLPFPVSAATYVAGYDIGLSTVNATNHYTGAIVSSSEAYIVRTTDSWTYPTPFEIHHLYLPGNNSYNISLSVPSDLPSGEYIVSGITEIIVHDRYVEYETFRSEPFTVIGYDGEGLLTWHTNTSTLRTTVYPYEKQRLTIHGYSPLVESLGTGKYIEFEVNLYSSDMKRLMTVLEYNDCRYFHRQTPDGDGIQLQRAGHAARKDQGEVAKRRGACHGQPRPGRGGV